MTGSVSGSVTVMVTWTVPALSGSEATRVIVGGVLVGSIVTVTGTLITPPWLSSTVTEKLSASWSGVAFSAEASWRAMGVGV